MDALVWDICGTGGTFWDTFPSWASKLWFTSAFYHPVGKEPRWNRQRANDAFSASFKQFEFPNQSYLNDLLAC